jgi:glycosyltransferase involved in cell wall biosynthesis
MNSARTKIAFVTTTWGTVRAFLLPHIRELTKRYDITIYSNFENESEEELRRVSEDIPISFEHVAFARKIDLWRDLKSWWRLFRLLRASRPAVLHSMMPKTGLVAMTSGLVAGVKVRIHMFTGQVWATRSGMSRLLLKTLDNVTSRSATYILADSPSQRQFLLSNGFRKDIRVLGHGSVAGVDTEKFKADAEKRSRVRVRHGIGEQALIFGFLGRMNRDKGVSDLLTAFARARLGPECHLLLVGPDEEGISALVETLAPAVKKRIHLAGFTSHPEEYLAAFDVYCLPSYREGFGTSAIEAAACGIPALVSEIYGLTDAVEQGVSGLFHKAADIDGIVAGLEKLASDPIERQKLSKNARIRVEENFSEAKMVEAMSGFYASLPR